MKWMKGLYVGESIKNQAHRIKWKVNHNAGTINVYLITFPSNPNNMLDIIPARELLQKSYPKNNLKIIGIASGWQESVELVSSIIEEAYNVMGTVDVYKYLKEYRRVEA